MTRPQPGRFQHGALEALYGAPGGLTDRDLMYLTPAWDAGSRQLAETRRSLRRMQATGLAAPGGTRPMVPGSRTEDQVWVITPRGRGVLTGFRGRHRLIPATRRARVLRRAEVAAALAGGFGPGTPEGERKERALAMKEAGCWLSDIALVFAISTGAAREITGGER